MEMHIFRLQMKVANLFLLFAKSDKHRKKFMSKEHQV